MIYDHEVIVETEMKFEVNDMRRLSSQIEAMNKYVAVKPLQL